MRDVSPWYFLTDFLVPARPTLTASPHPGLPAACERGPFARLFLVRLPEGYLFFESSKDHLLLLLLSDF